MKEDLAYYKGYEDGLKEGIGALRHLLEEGRTLEDVLKQYNELVFKHHDVFEKIIDIQQANPDLVYEIPSGE